MINFSEKYERKKFYHFLRQFLPEDLLENNEELQIGKSNEYFKSATLLGSIKSLEGLVVIEVERIRSEKSRITITKELFKFLDIYGYSKALVVTYSDKESHYRFSLIKSDLSWTSETKVKKEFSNPKRLSFLLGPEAKVHTATRQLIKLGKIANFEDLFNRFNIEVVNDEFFDHYKNLYLNLKKRFDGDKIFSSFTKKYEIDNAGFAKKLLGQIVFCYFLQRKGWLGVEKSKKFGNGDYSFIRNKFKEYESNKKNFFNNFLEYFFYEGLNKENQNDYVEKIKTKVPYIGGGLFEYHDGYNWKVENLKISNEIFSNNKHDGILDIFDLYNFTIDENDDIDLEISIDPEMLGRVFENLLEENIRKSGGSFYTPRTIVNYMCNSSIIYYLYNNLKNTINFKTIESFVTNVGFDISKEIKFLKKTKEIDDLLYNLKICDPAIGSGAFAVGIVNLIARLRNLLKSFVNRKYKNTSYYFKRDCIQNSIYGVDFDSSAVEITKLRLWLSLIVDEDDFSKTEPLPNLDFQILQGNSLINKIDGYNFHYLDIQKEDYQFELLPNDVWDKFSKVKNDFINLKKKYFDIKNFKNKDETRKKIETILIELTDLAFALGSTWDKKKNADNIRFNKIRSNKNFFLWKLYFIEIFQDNPGFDIIIANPPYIGEKSDKYKFQEVKNFSDLDRFYKKRMDYLYFFFHLGLDILKKDGILNFITTNYYTTATGATKLRADIKLRASFLKAINFNELKIFKSAQGQHNMISTLIKNSDNQSTEIIQTQRSGYGDVNILKDILNNVDKKTSYKILNSKDIFEGEESYIRLEGNFSSGKNIENDILKKISNNNDKLINLCNVNAGLVTGLDKVSEKHIKIDAGVKSYIGKGVYVLSNEEVSSLNLQDNEKSLFKKLYKNSDIHKYYCNNFLETKQKNVAYLTRDLDINDYPNIKKHLTKFKKIIENRSKERGEIQAALKLGKWWVIFSARNKDIFENEKIICPQRSNLNTFAYDNGEFYTSGDVYFITKKDNNVKLKYILSILNSKLYYFWLKKRGKLKGKMLELYYKPLTEIPIKLINKNDESYLIEIINKLLKLKKVNHEYIEFEKKINQIIYKNYDLTTEEIKFIEDFYP